MAGERDRVVAVVSVHRDVAERVREVAAHRGVARLVARLVRVELGAGRRVHLELVLRVRVNRDRVGAGRADDDDAEIALVLIDEDPNAPGRGAAAGRAERLPVPRVVAGAVDDLALVRHAELVVAEAADELFVSARDEVVVVRRADDDLDAVERLAFSVAVGAAVVVHRRRVLRVDARVGEVHDDAVDAVAEARVDWVAVARRHRRHEGDDVLALVAEERVVAGVAAQVVVAATAVELVGAVAADEQVVAVVAEELVVEDVAEEHVVAVAAVDLVAARAAVDDVVAVARVDDVVARPAVDVVVAVAAVDLVLAAARADEVVARVAPDDVASFGADDDVGVAGADEDVHAVLHADLYARRGLQVRVGARVVFPDGGAVARAFLESVLAGADGIAARARAEAEREGDEERVAESTRSHASLSATDVPRCRREIALISAGKRAIAGDPSAAATLGAGAPVVGAE